MNPLIANQYGRVQGEAGGCGLTAMRNGSDLAPGIERAPNARRLG